MSKIIIDNRCEWLNAHTAMACVADVIQGGRVSSGLYGEQFCHLTTFTFRAGKIGVSADKTKTGTDKFILFETK